MNLAPGLTGLGASSYKLGELEIRLTWNAHVSTVTWHSYAKPVLQKNKVTQASSTVPHSNIYDNDGQDHAWNEN